MIKFTDVIFDTLTEEVKNKKLFAKLMDNWRNQKPNITDEEGEELFNSFARIQGGLRPDIAQVYTFLNRFDGNHGHELFNAENIKDITKYSYNQLKFLLDEYKTDAAGNREQDVFSQNDPKPTPEKIQASKNLWTGNDNLIFEKDGLRVYDIKDQIMSIRYGYYMHTVYKTAMGYGEDYSNRDISPWCVTWRPDMNKSNMWGNYRSQGRSFYFVIDENKPPRDRYYMSALQRVTDRATGFVLTSLKNDGDNSMTWEEIEAIYPELRGQKDLFKVKPYNEDELKLQDVVGQINENPGNRYEFRRMDRQLKMAYIQNGGVLQRADSWKSMDSTLRNAYIVYPDLNQYSVKQRYSNFDFVNEIRKVGNEYNLLDRTIKQKGIPDGAAFIFDYLMSSEFKVARVSADNKNIRLYESRVNKKSGLYDIRKNDWVEMNGITYEPLYNEVDTDIYTDSEGNLYMVETFSKSTQATEDSFYSVYLHDEAQNPNYDSHFMSSKKFRELLKELTPEDGAEPETDNPSGYSDIKEKRGI